ncbi:hypothetical protein ACIBHX_02770 [Nonomuraea sp. NPDC050536]|uniref:hypothetical protein n=1 Tax=Nonomuraea sp. NPDC050536 TaxID=3364366 RepID=UPI0037C71984
MPSATRAGPVLGRRAPAPVVLHSAPLVLPIGTEPLRDGAVAIRGDRVLRVGPRAELLGLFAVTRERRWPGALLPGLVDARATRRHPGAPGSRTPGSGTPGRSAQAGERSCAPGFGVTTRAGVVGEPGEAGWVPDLGYVPVTSPGVEEWDERDRDLLITAIREVERPSAIGVAAYTADLQVLEDVAVLARTFGLRLLVDLDRHSLAALDEAGILGPHCHAACSRSLDPGERKLLRLRHTVAALCPPPPDDALTLIEEGNLVALGSGGLGDPLAQARTVLAQARGRTPRPRGLDGKLVEAATLGGARALGLAEGAGRIGTLGRGSRADLAVFAAGGRYPYASLLDGVPCLGTVIGGVEL